MVCHESYKDLNGNWLYPEEVQKTEDQNFIKKTDKTKVIVGPAESMSKSKKNTVDPEKMIKNYGADSVRWFILSDSPPEKDVQWSDIGVISANKFLQKIYNLIFLVTKRSERQGNKKMESEFVSSINTFVGKIDNSINNFRFNVAIAQFYEVYNFFKSCLEKELSNKILQENITKIMKIMIPFTPHLAYECLEMLKCTSIEQWPKIDKKNISEITKLAIQVNGKTRDILEVKKDLSEDQIKKEVLNKSKAKKYIDDKKIIRTIFVKNKILNYITSLNE